VGYRHIFRHNLQTVTWIVALAFGFKLRHNAQEQRLQQLQCPGNQAAADQLLLHLQLNEAVDMRDTQIFRHDYLSKPDKGKANTELIRHAARLVPYN